MPQLVACPSCGKKVKVPDALLGKSVKCQCAHVFMTPAPTMNCPGCGSAVPEDAGSCTDCGYKLSGPDVATIEREEVGEKLNVCPNKVCGTLNPPGERLCQRCTTPLPAIAGQIIAGKYRLDQPIGSGGFGVVYKATVITTGEAVAIKEMIADDAREFGIRRTFFRREAEILRALQHVPIVPRLIELVEDATSAYLVIEYIPGDNLQNLIDQPGAKPFPVPTVAAWGARICEAIAQMHKMKPAVIHRDMKPENIMLLPDGTTIRLIDFGTAREMGHGTKERGVAKTKVYTEGYAPPEQIMGKPEPRSDLFALAGTLFHLATGRAPEGFLTGRELTKKLAEYPESDRWFYELIAMNLSEEVCDRYLTVRDMKGDLERRSITREIYCPICGTATPAREPYCRGCAGPMAPSGSPCHNCEKPTLLGSRFCVICGARL
jgi:serine/threonine protein kinase